MTLPTNTFCAAPWYATYYKDSLKKYKMCCVFDPWMEAESPQDYYNSPLVQDVRDKMLKGEWHSGCADCQSREESKMISDRTTFNHYFEKDIAKGFDTGQFKLKWLDYRPGNLCNLKCRMCHPSNSSLIDKETQENEELQEFMGKKHYPVNDDLLPNICNKETFENLEVLKILGGEPTIDPQVTKLLEWTVGNGYAKDINLRFTTNATNMNKRWVEAVNQFKTCKIQISLDGTGPTYDYIRTGANWSKIKENTLRCPEMYNNIRAMGSNIVYSVYNCFTVDQWLPELKQIRREIKDQGINYEFNVINCTTPAHQKVSNLPDELKQVILDKIDALGFEDEVTHSIRTYTELPAVGPPSGHAFRFFKHNDILDRLRRTNIETLSPEYKQLREVSNA